MSAITAKASRKMKKYAVLTREPRCFLGSFDFSWEQRKLGDVVQITMGQSPDGSTYSDEPSDYILVQGNADLQNGWVCPRIWTTQITKKADAGDLIMSVRAPAGAMGKTAYNAVIGRGVAAIKGNEFIYQLLVKMDADGFWKTLSCGSTFESLNSDNIKNAEVKIPTTAEQIKIGGYFQQLDNLITLHQRKCVFLFGFFQAFISMIFTASTFSWEQRKAIDIADYSKGNGYSKGDLTDAGTPIILYGRLYTKYQFAISEVDTFAVPRNGAVYSQGNEVIVPASGETAEDIARASAVEKSGVLLGGDLNILRPFDFINPLFLALAISNGEPQKELAKKAQGKSVVHIHNTDIQEVTIAYPSRTEQDRIVSVFRQLDHLITLHQRECISFTARAGRLILTANKKRNTSSWEQRKLGEMGQTYTGLSGKTKDDFGHGQARFVTYMNVFSNPISNPEMTEPIEIDLKQNEVEVGDVFFTTSSETPEEVGMSSILLEKRGKTYLNSFCFGFRPSEKIDSYYLAYMLRSESTRAKIVLLAQGISRYNISKNKVMEIAVSLPSLDEQKMIGQYFSQLDNLITLHQRKPFLMKWRTSDANRNQTNRLVL